MYHRTKGLKLSNFKSPCVTASWLMTVLGFFVARAILEPSQRYSLEHLGVAAIAGISCGTPLAVAAFLDYREVPERTKVPDEELESLLDFLD
jgi:hypothetical protein